MNNTGIKEAAFSCERDHLIIRGMQYLPDEDAQTKTYPAIIVSHGFGGNYTSNETMCRMLAKRGYAVFSFSFCGGSDIDTKEELKSDGDTVDTTIMTEVSDLLAVKTYVQQLPYVDAHSLSLLGISQGGMVTGLAAAQCNDEIKKIIMIYPALCIPDHARRGCLGGASYDVENVPEVINCRTILLGKKFHDEAVRMDVFLKLRPYKGPVLILQGMEDKIVNYSYAIRARENYQPGQCQLQLLRNVGHGFNQEQEENVVASIHQFLLGRKELFTIRVVITHRELAEGENYKEIRTFFTGYCDNEHFHGTIIPGGCDVRRDYLDGAVSMIADYTMQGIDVEGRRCKVRIVNQQIDGEWKPIIETDSKALAWMENVDATAVLERGNGGPIMRIFGNLFD